MNQIPPGVYALETLLQVERDRLAKEIELAAMDILDARAEIDMPDQFFDLYKRALMHAAEIVRNGER